MKPGMLCRLAIAAAVALLLAACIANRTFDSALPAAADTKLADYAEASCLSSQPNAVIAEQGNAWANAIVQGTSYEAQVFARVSDVVKKSLALSDLPITHLDAPVGSDVRLYVAHCHEISRIPAVRAAVSEGGDAAVAE